MGRKYEIRKKDFKEGEEHEGEVRNEEKEEERRLD